MIDILALVHAQERARERCRLSHVELLQAIYDSVRAGGAIAPPAELRRNPRELWVGIYKRDSKTPQSHECTAVVEVDVRTHGRLHVITVLPISVEVHLRRELKHQLIKRIPKGVTTGRGRRKQKRSDASAQDC